MKHKLTAIAMAASMWLTACGGGSSSQGSPDTGAAAATEVELVDGFSTPTSVKTVNIAGVAQVVAADQLLLVLAEDVTQDQFNAIKARLLELGVRSAGQRMELRMLALNVPGTVTDQALIDALSSQPGVVHIGYNHVVQTARANPLQSAMPQRRAQATTALSEGSGSTGSYWATHIDLATAQDVETQLGITGGPLVAVVDTGLAAGQTVLDESRVRRVNALGQGITGDSTADVINHGRDVTGFALGNSAGAAGVSRFANLLMVDVYSDECKGLLSVLGCPLGIGRTFQTQLAEGLLTALRSDARAINVSWGDGSECADSQATRLAARQGWRAIYASSVNLARRLDKLILFSSGNNCEKRDDQLLPNARDVAADSWLSNALIVGASTAARQDALFSRMGGVVNLLAPGESVDYGGGLMDGTSFATPLVTGAAALIQGINTQLSAPEVRYLLVNGAEATLSFADAAKAAYGGYSGANAATPNLLLNVGNSARAAKLTRDAALQTLPEVSLAKGASKTVTFEVEIPATGVRALDVVFLVDVSGSYGDDIATLKRQASAIVDALSARGIDVQFGVSAFADFPFSPYGGSGDQAYQRLTRVTANKSAVLSGINALSLQYGNDEPESQLEALYQVATGSGRDINGDGTVDGSAGDIAPQPMGFRPGAAKVVLFATDANFHDADTESGYPGAGYSRTVTALKAQGIKVIALQSGSTATAAADIARLVSATGGASYQLSWDSAQIADAIAAGIDTSLAEIEVGVDKVAGAEWFSGITQDKTHAKPGERVKFTATLQGQRSQSVDNLAYDLYLWVRGNGSALLQRVKQPVRVAP